MTLNRSGGSMNRVLWNNEMDLCIGLMTEMDQNEFIEEVEKTHYLLTGESISVEKDNISIVDGVIFKFEMS